MRYYKAFDQNATLHGRPMWPDGEWMPAIAGKLQECGNGYHIMTSGDLGGWVGPRLAEVEVVGKDRHMKKFENEDQWRTIPAARVDRNGYPVGSTHDENGERVCPKCGGWWYRREQDPDGNCNCSPGKLPAHLPATG